MLETRTKKIKGWVENLYVNKQQTHIFAVGEPELPYFRANIWAHLIQHVYSSMHILDILVWTDADRVQERRAFCSPDTYISSTLQESLIWPEGWKCDCVKYKLDCILMIVINTALFGRGGLLLFAASLCAMLYGYGDQFYISSVTSNAAIKFKYTFRFWCL